MLAEALPWLKHLHHKIVVVKYGGHAMLDDNLRRAFAADMVFLRNCGILPRRRTRRGSTSQRDARNGSVSPANSRAASGWSPPRCSMWRGWCCSATSVGNW